MGDKCSNRHRAWGTLAAVCAAILPVVANVQDTAIDPIEAIERNKTFDTHLEAGAI